MPLWFIEGMAEYLSIGPRDPQTAIWLRDAAIEDKLPTIDQLDDPRYFPYRWGQAFWAYLSGRWGDQIVSDLLHAVAATPGERGTADPIEMIEQATGRDRKALSEEWHEAIRETYSVQARPKGEAPASREGEVVIGFHDDSGTMNVGPALSPDGKQIAFLSERNRLSVDLYLADAASGKVIRKLISTAVDPHFQSLQFLMSAGTWDPSGRRLAVATVRGGHPVVAIIDTTNGSIEREVPFKDLGEIFQPAWSPDGKRIAFSAQVGGFTDLFVYDLATAQTERLTDDAFADLQPDWAPDGGSLLFVTDRFTTKPDTLAFGRYRLGRITPGSKAIQAVDTGLQGNVIDPHFLADGLAVLFLSDDTGRPEAYRYDLSSGRSVRLTNAATGVAGITPLSPALSVAAQTSEVAYSVFRDRGFDIHIADRSELTPQPATPPDERIDLARLPPLTRRTSTVEQMIQQPEAGLVPAQSFETKPYKPSLSLVDIGQQIGVASASQFGTYVSGGVSMTFSDVLGNHLLGTSFGVNGGLSDVLAQAVYLNRSSRWNWGVFGDRVPYLSGSVATGFVQQGGQVLYEQQIDRLRQTYSEIGALTAYPLSRATRLELNASTQHISFTREVRTIIADPVTGAIISDQTQQIPTADSLTLYGVGTALVRDTSVFGATGPLLGQRAHLEAQPTFGDLRLTNVTADYRQYFMPVRPVTIAGRVLHVGRYGGSGEDQRLVPLFLGYSDLVRGYDVGSFDANECTPTPDGSCPEFDRLLGSRLLVANLEVRAPLVGLFKGQLDYGGVPVDVFAFADGGVAWTRQASPSFAGGTRDWVTSVGAGARVNVFGFAIAEFNAVRPLDRPGRGWMFVFNLRPGF